ncbi:MAG TPA: tetratricopeptide repeat protein, partial [Pyrinomonadaceae bacterium]|nr:tetratricopeptide repeat protein [Pyrinomonadaceae bacterium]
MLAEGLAALDRGDTSVAREFLERALAADPRNAEAHTYLGVIADRAGDLPEAERHFGTAARLKPQSARAHNNYGAVLLRLNRSREAATEFEASLRLDPKQAKALVNLAQIRFDSGTAEGLRAADELFRRADALAPDVEIARALTVIALRRNDPVRAADYYRSYATRLAHVADQILLAAERSDLGGALLEVGLLTEAEAELKAALSVDPANVDSVVRLARVSLARKDIPAAGRTLEGALARKVEAAPIYALLAVVYQKSGHIENAIPAMRRAIQLDPQSERYRFQYGILLIDANAPAAAEIRLQEALQSFPKSARLWLALGLAYLKMNKNNEAAQGFNRALEFQPDFAQAYAYLGIAQVALGQYAEGTRFYEQALQKNPRIAVIHYLLADALLNQTDPDIPRIETHLKQAVQLDPTYAPARMALGKLYARTEHLPEALAEFQRATEVDPNLAEAYYQLGRAYRRLK